MIIITIVIPFTLPGGHDCRLCRAWGHHVHQQGRPEAVPGEHGHHGHHPKEVQVQAARSRISAQSLHHDRGGHEEHHGEHLHRESPARGLQLRPDD